VERIFPTAPDKQILFDAAWSMFLGWSGSIPNENWLALLRPSYDHALKLRATDITEKPRDSRRTQLDADERALASELGALYMYGLLDLAAGDLLDRYFAQAGDEDVRIVVNVLHRSLERAVQPQADAIQDAEDEPRTQLAVLVQKARELWNWRRATIFASPSQLGHGSEAAAFAHLFLIEQFSAKECLVVVEELLPIAALNPWDSALLERLATLALDHPASCLRIVRKFIERGGYPDHEKTRTVLQAALHCGEPIVEEDARALINQLSAGGYSKVDDLLSEDRLATSNTLVKT
jgi:hypothetical protein